MEKHPAAATSTASNSPASGKAPSPKRTIKTPKVSKLEEPITPNSIQPQPVPQAASSSSLGKHPPTEPSPTPDEPQSDIGQMQLIVALKQQLEAQAKQMLELKAAQTDSFLVQDGVEDEENGDNDYVVESDEENSDESSDDDNDNDGEDGDNDDAKSISGIIEDDSLEDDSPEAKAPKRNADVLAELLSPLKTKPKRAKISPTKNIDAEAMLQVLGSASKKVVLKEDDDSHADLVLDHKSFRKLRDEVKKKLPFFYSSKANKKGTSTSTRPIRFQYLPKTKDTSERVLIFNSYCLFGTFKFEDSTFEKSSRKGMNDDYPESKCKDKEAHWCVEIGDVDARRYLALVIANLFVASQHPIFVQKGLLPYLFGLQPSSSVDLKTWTAVPSIGFIFPTLRSKLLSAKENNDPEVIRYIEARACIADFLLSAAEDKAAAEGKKAHAISQAKDFYKSIDINHVSAKEFQKTALALAHRNFNFWAGEDTVLPVKQNSIIGGPVSDDNE